ncbi:hypothetical protein [Ferrigenium sp. UT5]|uniref:hypothetical protein n=1 Tax=Ferrigenium sp. UT5 TaxID=3242105 RepID=UPI0035545081
MGGWGCPHELDGKCQKVLNRPCDIGMKGCVLAGRFRFADERKNRQKQNKAGEVGGKSPTDTKFLKR